MGVLISGFVGAQNFYFQLGAGYSFGTQGQSNISFLSEEHTVRSIGTTVPTYNYGSYEDQLITLGQGWNLSAGIGYQINRLLHVEIRSSFLSSSEINSHFYSSFTGYENGVPQPDLSSYNNQETKINGQLWRVTPLFGIKTDFERVNLSAKIGPSIGFGNYSFSHVNTTQVGYSTEKYAFSGGVNLGVNAIIQLQIPINDNFDFWVEGEYVGLINKATKRTLEEATINGTDVLPSIPEESKTVEISDKQEFDTRNGTNFANPTTNTMPFNSIGINIGVKYTLAKKQE